MPVMRKRRFTRIAPTCQALEGRELLSSFAPRSPAAEVAPLPKAPALFTEPEAGRCPILAAINAARTDIRLGICNLSDPRIGDALAAAVARGVNARVIIDQTDYHAKPEEQREIANLIAAGVSVHLSNPVFPQSFEKYLVIDQRRVLVMTLCLVPPTFEDTRDYGVVVADRGVIREVTTVFENDWRFTAPPGFVPPAYNPTPRLHVHDLIWAPTDATSKLTRLIQSARRTLDVTSEIIDDAFLEGQLIAAANRGVRVRLIAPLDAREAVSNAAQLAFLENHGVRVRVTTGLFPPAGALPYMHAKTMVIDGRAAYLGSIDLSARQRSEDRELGIVLRRRTLIAPIAAQFQSDWDRAQPLPP